MQVGALMSDKAVCNLCYSVRQSQKARRATVAAAASEVVRERAPSHSVGVSAVKPAAVLSELSLKSQS